MITKLIWIAEEIGKTCITTCSLAVMDEKEKSLYFLAICNLNLVRHLTTKTSRCYRSIMGSQIVVVILDLISFVMDPSGVCKSKYLQTKSFKRLKSQDFE